MVQPLRLVIRALGALLIACIAWTALTFATVAVVGSLAGFTGHPAAPAVPSEWYVAYVVVSPLVALALGWLLAGRLLRALGGGAL